MGNHQLRSLDFWTGVGYTVFVSSRGVNMKPDTRLREKREEILRIAERYGASNVRVFGSVARGEASADSGDAVPL